MYNYLKRVRKFRGYTCKEMAKYLKISPCYYSQLENRKRTLSYSMAVKISSILKFYPDDIFYDDHKKDRVIINKPRKEIKVYSYFHPYDESDD